MPKITLTFVSLIPTSSSPDSRVPSFAAGVLSNTCKTWSTVRIMDSNEFRHQCSVRLRIAMSMKGCGWDHRIIDAPNESCGLVFRRAKNYFCHLDNIETRTEWCPSANADADKVAGVLADGHHPGGYSHPPEWTFQLVVKLVHICVMPVPVGQSSH